MIEILYKNGNLSSIPNDILDPVFRETNHKALKCAFSRAVVRVSEGLSSVPSRKFSRTREVSPDLQGRRPSRALRSPGWHAFCPIRQTPQNVQEHTAQNVLFAHRLCGVSTHTPLKTKRSGFGTWFAVYYGHEHAQGKQSQAVGRGGRLVGRGQRQCRETP